MFGARLASSSLLRRNLSATPVAAVECALDEAAAADTNPDTTAGEHHSASAIFASTAVSVVIVPGWRNSGLGHWQSLWAQRIPGAIRVQQQEWQQPHKAPWVECVVQAIVAAPHPVVLAAHSLGCIASIHAIESLGDDAAARIAGALLVAPADPERRAVFDDFTPVPAQQLPFTSIVAASSNDPYCPIRTASAYAKSWGSTFVRVPDAGHINTESGHGEWPLGWALLGALAAQTQLRRAVFEAA